MRKDHPYRDLQSRSFWRNSVSELNPLEFADLYRPKFKITSTDRIAAAGSCFAQHISREFKRRQFNFLDLEPPPALLPQHRWKEFGYDLYSARYGNVYTIRQLLQLVSRAFGRMRPVDEVWESDGRYFDPYRPAIEPSGFDSLEELRVFGDVLLQSVRTIVETCDVFVFTFGLTEAWINTKDGFVYPSCPGTVAGTFDPDRHRFHNFAVSEIVADTETLIDFIRKRNPGARFLFTVSPVPLVASASGDHVLPATVYSKSVLRAACGELEKRHSFVDYFPSYEMVASHPYRAMFFAPNMRDVSAMGVAHVMNTFFGAHRIESETVVELKPKPMDRDSDDELVCEEVALEAFGR
jgi:hypothetical protein